LSEHKTEVVTFRLPKNLVNQLRKEADNQRINTSAVMNQIVSSYFDYHKMMAGRGMVVVPKKALVMMLNSVPEKQMLDLAKSIQDEFVNFAYLKEGGPSTDSMLQTFMAWLHDSGIQTREVQEDSERVIVVNHEMGRKMATLLSELFTSSFDGAGSKVTTENDLTIIRMKVDSDGQEAT
jgi:hypothetical protein